MQEHLNEQPHKAKYNANTIKWKKWSLMQP